MLIRRALQYAAAVAFGATTAVALAKLPAPSPEQAEVAAAKKEKEKAALEVAQRQLEQAQDRTVAHYRRTKGGSDGQPTAGPTEKENLPKAAVVPPRQAGPQGGRQQSAEAHSAPAK